MAIDARVTKILGLVSGTSARTEAQDAELRALVTELQNEAEKAETTTTETTTTTSGASASGSVQF